MEYLGIELPSCQSTNKLAMEVVHGGLDVLPNYYRSFLGNPQRVNWPIGLHQVLVINTPNQTNGVGQMGSVWHTEAGKNITLSLIIRPAFLPAHKQFELSIVAALTIADFFLQLGLDDVAIKWSNDILIGKRKISGILIENVVRGTKIEHSVIGFGLNINQQLFSINGATSVFIEKGEELDITYAIQLLIKCFDFRYQQLRDGKIARLKTDFYQKLYGYQQTGLFKLPNTDNSFFGVISGVDASGRLAIMSSGRLHYFSNKEVEFVL